MAQVLFLPCMAAVVQSYLRVYFYQTFRKNGHNLFLIIFSVKLQVYVNKCLLKISRFIGLWTRIKHKQRRFKWRGHTLRKYNTKISKQANTLSTWAWHIKTNMAKTIGVGPSRYVCQSCQSVTLFRINQLYTVSCCIRDLQYHIYNHKL